MTDVIHRFFSDISPPLRSDGEIPQKRGEPASQTWKNAATGPTDRQDRNNLSPDILRL